MNDKSLTVILPYSLSAYSEDGEKKDDDGVQIAAFSVVLRADYGCAAHGDMPGVDELPHYAGLMSYMHTWPYFRADIQYLSTKLGFPPLVLPVVLSGHVPARASVFADPVEADEANDESTIKRLASSAAKATKRVKRARAPK
ncbi:hypothetical protein WME75_04085 [Sorangium sp. So ce1014]|uniref:hypothetical protein n=1 Tax=Sorangium sp. So ce1014 TaxID=3133326 RepID=UPI003F5EA9D7